MSRNIFRRCEACLEAGCNLNYRGKINSKLLLDTGLLCSKVLCWGTQLEVQCVVSKHYKYFMSHSATVFMLHVGFSCIFWCFMLVCFVIYFLILQLVAFLLSCCMNAVALFLLFNESVIVYVLNFYASFVFLQKLL